MTNALSTPAAIILLVLAGYLLVRVFLLARPMHERTFKEIFEDMALELVGALIIVIGVMLFPLFL
jgi:hypothetical protein